MNLRFRVFLTFGEEIKRMVGEYFNRAYNIILLSKRYEENMPNY